ncbi:hypothetical protein [Flavobacterium phage FpV4]|uniref:Lipoprotein n=2 Tax=Fipvunavirus Fpv4 TaxID=2560476 RepID=A0A1B0WMJ6_9CAUD|nr:hypothetical protein BOW80_gp73 [Flavobacterium phage Fpv3]YP_009594126.1 hypothetical protein FDG89_gp70 [Flavobacterium phage FpV4]ALN97183.1 hypothetical protein [Flavobacterium phage FpV4]ANB40475.1 hypothetical protein [Flavobacterium phage Fpv3]
MKNFKFLLLTLLSLVIFSCSTDEAARLSSENQFKVIVSASITTNNCNTITSPYIVDTQFISDNSTETFTNTGSNPSQIDYEKVLSGTNIGVKIKLPAFNNNNANSGKGIAVQYVTIKIINVETGEIVLNKTHTQTFELYICTDTIYEATLLYNTAANTYVITKGVWNF